MSYVTPAQLKSGLQGAKDYADSKGAGFTKAYIVGSTALASDWLSDTAGGTALTPDTESVYVVQTAGDYFGNLYMWNGTEYYPVGVNNNVETDDTPIKQLIFALHNNRVTTIQVDTTSILDTISVIHLKDGENIVDSVVPTGDLTYFGVYNAGTYVVAITVNGEESERSITVSQIGTTVYVVFDESYLPQTSAVIHRFSKGNSYSIIAPIQSSVSVEKRSIDVTEANKNNIGVIESGISLPYLRFKFDSTAPSGATSMIKFASINLSDYANKTLHVCYKIHVEKGRSSVGMAYGGTSLGLSTTANGGRATNSYKDEYIVEIDSDSYYHKQYALSQYTSEQLSDFVVSFYLGQGTFANIPAYIDIFQVYVD